MILLNKLKDTEALEKYRMVLAKTETHQEIADAMARIGFGPAVIEEGKELLRTTREFYDANARKHDELLFVRAEFLRQKRLVDLNYRTHRKKARLLLGKDSGMAETLAVYWKYYKRYTQWIEMVKIFYREATNDQEILEKLLLLKITKEEIDKELVRISELEHLWAERMKMKAIAQDSTEKKIAAFAKLKDWMRQFFGAAKLALVNEPELMEALGRLVSAPSASSARAKRKQAQISSTKDQQEGSTMMINKAD